MLAYLFVLLGAFVCCCTAAKQHVILLSAPLSDEAYYKDEYDDILKYQAKFLSLVQPPDRAFILADDEGRVKLRKLEVPESTILPVVAFGIWMRDFSPVRASKRTQFKYRPVYLTEEVADQIQTSLLQGFKEKKITLQSGKTSLKLDGGNVVDNEKDTAIITSRVLDDNNNLEPEEVVEQLKKDLGYERVIIVDELPNDTTAHTDGMMSFLNETVLAVGDLDSPYYEDLMEKLGDGLSSKVKIITLPVTNDPSRFTSSAKEKQSPFPTACGLHVNLIATDANLYVPTFGHDEENRKLGHTAAHDDKVVRMIEKNTHKKVFRIPVPNQVCKLGGSVRCLSWQAEGSVGNQIIQLAENNN